jgi:hypothetical protein
MCQDEGSSKILLEDNLFRDGNAAIESRCHISECISTNETIEANEARMFHVWKEVVAKVVTSPLAPG